MEASSQETRVMNLEMLGTIQEVQYTGEAEGPRGMQAERGHWE
jgi:hypothetical protein